jgi:hypothetical protein
MVFSLCPDSARMELDRKLMRVASGKRARLKLRLDIKADTPSKASTGASAVKFSQTWPEAYDPVDRRREREDRDDVAFGKWPALGRR